MAHIARFALAAVALAALTLLGQQHTKPVAASGTAEQLEDVQLGLMVLPLADYEAKFSLYVVDASSGFAPDQEFNDVIPGRMNGYYLNYVVVRPTTMEEPALLNTDVDLFDNADSAAAYRDSKLAEAQAQVGETVDGVTLEAITEFPVAGVGDGAIGARLRFDVDGTTLWVTSVVFTVDRVGGDVEFFSFDDSDMNAQITDLAQAQAERMKGVLTGDITSTSIPLPPDPNCDGDTNSIDAALLLQYTAGLLADLPCGAIADANQNGGLDSVDAAIALQVDAGLLLFLAP